MSNTEFKRVFGFDESNHQTYEALRKRIQAYMKKNGIVNKTQAGDDKWLMLVDWVTGHPYMNPAQQRLREGDVDEEVMRKAVHFLCLSCSRNNGISSRERSEQELLYGEKSID